MGDKWKDWTWHTLSGLADIIMGQSPPGETYNEIGNGLPFFQGAKDFGNRYPTCRVYCSEPTRIAEKGDVLISVRAPIGRVNRAIEKSSIGRGVAAIRGKTPTDTTFIEYLLKAREMAWDAHESEGSVFGNLRKEDLVNLKFKCPPEKERAAIASILGALDDKIELNRKMNETLEAMARAIFKSWFVDFLPVRAKRRGEPMCSPNSRADTQVCPYMTPEILSLFPDSFVDSPLGKIPEGWRVGSLNEIADYLNGLALQKHPPDNDYEFLPVIKIAQLRKDSTEGSDKTSVNIDPSYVVSDGDILFSWSGSLEVVTWCGGRGALNQHLFKVTSKNYPKWFYYLWTKHHLPDFQTIAAGKATTMGHIQRHHLAAAKVLVPPPNLLKAMDTIMSPLIENKIINSVQSRTLASIRNALLPKLLSGEIRVKDVERFVERNV